MKRNLFLLIVLFLVYQGFSQKYVFDYYGMELPQYSSGVEFTDAKFIIEKTDGDVYKLEIFQNKEEVGVVVAVKFEFEEGGEYAYTGLTNYLGTEYTCLILTKTKLSDFLKGNGNPYKDAFKSEFCIRLFYGKNPTSMLDLNKNSNFYPIKLNAQ